MPTIKVSWSKKTPIQGVDYSSEGATAELEVSLPEGVTNEQLVEKMNEGFGLVGRAVESRLAEAQAQAEAQAEAQAAVDPPTNPDEDAEAEAEETEPRRQAAAQRPSGPRRQSSNGQPASDKQVSAIFAIAKSAGYSRQQILTMAQKRYNAGSVEDLSRVDASAFITYLRRQEAAG